MVPASRFRRGDSYVVHRRDVYLRWEKRMTVEPQLRSPTKRTKTEIFDGIAAGESYEKAKDYVFHGTGDSCETYEK